MFSFLCIVTSRARKKIIGYQRIPDFCRERQGIQDENLMPTHLKLAGKDVGAF